MKMYVRAGSSFSSPTGSTFTPASFTPVHAPHIPMRYRKLTSRVMYVQGKPRMTAKGKASVQKLSITMVPIKDACLLRASIRLSAMRHGEISAEPRYSPHPATQTQLLPVPPLSTAACDPHCLLAHEPAAFRLHAIVPAFAQNPPSVRVR